MPGKNLKGWKGRGTPRGKVARKTLVKVVRKENETTLVNVVRKKK